MKYVSYKETGQRKNDDSVLVSPRNSHTEDILAISIKLVKSSWGRKGKGGKSYSGNYNIMY